MANNRHEKQLSELSKLVAEYIGDQRAEFREKGRPISSKDTGRLSRFFPADVLENVRIIGGRIAEPSFYSQLPKMGIDNAPPFSDMAGITFEDVIIHAAPLSRSLLFHELVHAVQYKHLRRKRFAELYVSGFFRGGSYEEIPLEKQAYELEARYAENPTVPFSVEDDVKRRIRTDSF